MKLNPDGRYGNANNFSFRVRTRSKNKSYFLISDLFFFKSHDSLEF